MSYGKLVRDQIPKIIENNGKTPITRTLSGDEYRRELLRKLVEEAQELLDSGGDISERVDVEELIRAIDREFNFSIEEIESLRRQKEQTRGGFAQRVYLEGVVDE